MIKINFLYWNVNNKNISLHIAEACIENEIDVLILAEHKNIDIDYLKRKLSENNLYFEVENIVPNSRIVLLHNAKKNIKVIKESKYYSAFLLRHNNDEVLIFAVHLPSKYAQETSELNMHATQIIREFEQIEEKRNIDKSIVIGDFNMNPFDEGMISALGFNAVMCPSIARKKSRKVLGNEHRFYYNPMWHVMGNHNNVCKGTYYYGSSTKSYYWYTYDQVISIPELIDDFNIAKLDIVDNINGNSLLTKGKTPNKINMSDHLPIRFTIETEVI